MAKTAKYTRRFLKLRAIWCIIRGGTVVMNVSVQGTAKLYATGNKKYVQYNNVLNNGLPVRLSDLIEG